ncbi:apolipoprotein D-like [Dreissena polymorpha]|uniref:apolipoprotein D-like n=1 Tax=Dreissena polymorpha TaxID=45954 RepID=UPI002264167F|nr:apolipoprotein D-like [Dreissena polymorpha]
MWKNTFIVSLATIAGLLPVCEGQVTDFGCCPNVKVQENFDIKRYMGRWFEERKFYAEFQAGVTCSFAEYTLQGDGTVKVNNTGYREMTGNYTSIIGQAQILDPREPAKLGVRFFPGTPLGNYWVLETDYDQYSIVYSCTQTSRFFNSQFCWILTRRPGPVPASVLDRIYSLLKGYEINPDYFKVNDRTRCPRV